jgi:hypothetical protein|nr:MAG TPA: hypothetical protein [Caudoviricetes sp.]
MKREEILRLFRSLSKGNGYYGRLLADLNELSQINPESYESIMLDLENQNFQTPLDVVLFVEG